MYDNDRVLVDLKALDILQIATDLGRAPDKRNMIHCTIHNENTPSMRLNYPKRGHFKCFGCGARGSTIDLYAASLGLEFGEAVKEMKSRYLHIFESGSYKPLLKRTASPVIRKPQEPILPTKECTPIYTALQTFCRQHPTTSIKTQAHAYLTGRAFTSETLRNFGIFVIPDVKAVSDFLTSNYDRSLLEACGLFSPKGFLFYQHPIIIPYISEGQIVNLQGRCIGEPPAKRGKYQYLRNRPITTMFNIDAIKNLEPGSKVHLTEGAFDTMAATQKGGTSVSINSVSGFRPEWVKLFKGLSVCFFLDSDKAGQDAIEKIYPLFKAEGIPATRKKLPANCKDVNDWLIKWSGQVNGYPAFWDQ